MRPLALLFFIALAGPALADPMAAAGRIENVDNGSSCSGALVRADVVVTAAHCVKVDAPEKLVFRPGDGPGGVAIPASRIRIHPLYPQTRERVEWRLRFDLAVIELKFPISPLRAVPFAVGNEAQVGEDLFLVSWRMGEGHRPRQRRCPVIPGIHGLVTLGCRVEGGESGAPVLRQSATGLELIAVVSSRFQLLNQPVAQASDLRLRLPPLLDALKSGP